MLFILDEHAFRIVESVDRGGEILEVVAQDMRRLITRGLRERGGEFDERADERERRFA